MKKTLVATLLSTALMPLFSQESIIKEFSEPRRSNPWFNPICLYPSTLRMINEHGDANYYQLVNDIEKVLIYTLDSVTVASKDYKGWLGEYEKLGYVEYISLYGKQKIEIFGKESEYVGLVSTDDQVITFYLRGEIPFHKIPDFIQTFQSGDLLSIITERFQ